MKRKKKEIKRIIVISIPDNISLELADKLFSNIHTNDKGCWVRGDDSTIYTSIKYNGKTQRAHRVSYEIYNNRAIPFNMCGCHKCDVPACINPEHIFIGTNSDNIQDGRSKGRIFTVRPKKSKWADYPNSECY